MKLYNIERDPEKMVFEKLWGLDPIAWKYLVEWRHGTYKQHSIICKLGQDVDLNSKSVEWREKFRKQYSEKGLKIIVNKNESARAKRNGGKSLDRIDLCFHDKNRLKSNTVFTLFVADDSVSVIWRHQKVVIMRFNHIADALHDVIGQLKHPLVFNSDPHLPAKGNNRIHTQYYYQKIPKGEFNKILYLVQTIFEQVLFGRLLSEVCTHIVDTYDVFSFKTWPITRFPIRYLDRYYYDKESRINLANGKRKAIIDNGLVAK